MSWGDVSTRTFKITTHWPQSTVNYSFCVSCVHMSTNKTITAPSRLYSAYTRTSQEKGTVSYWQPDVTSSGQCVSTASKLRTTVRTRQLCPASSYCTQQKLPVPQAAAAASLIFCSSAGAAVWMSLPFPTTRLQWLASNSYTSLWERVSASVSEAR